MQYDAAFKGKAILSAEALCNRAARRKHNVPEDNMRRRWKNKDALLLMCSTMGKVFTGSQKGTFPELEVRLMESVVDRMESLLMVTTKMIQIKAREVAWKCDIPSSDFKASGGWVQKL